MEDFAVVQFERACAHDRAGREEEAIPCYEQALEAGLRDPMRAQALLGLGSSLRNVGRHNEAVHVLARATEEYPASAALPLFHALALRSAGREREAFALLGSLVVEHADLDGYARAATFYLEHLD